MVEKELKEIEAKARAFKTLVEEMFDTEPCDKCEYVLEYIPALIAEVRRLREDEQDCDKCKTFDMEKRVDALNLRNLLREVYEHLKDTADWPDLEYDHELDCKMKNLLGEPNDTPTKETTQDT